MNKLIALFAIAITLLAIQAPGASAAKSNDRPNIIFFIVDDYDKETSSAYSGPAGLTPSMERLAARGIKFNKMHMTSTVCTPSRYTCLTGRYAGSSYHPDYLEECPLGEQGLPAFNVGLEADNMNVAQVLSDSGYVTGFVGKYHVGGHKLDESNRLPKGTLFSEALNEKQSQIEKETRKIIQDKGFHWAKNTYIGNFKDPFRGHNPEWTMSAALEFIDSNTKKPFFLYYATTLVHGTPGEWDKSLDKPTMTGAGIIEKPYDLLDRESVRTRLVQAGLDPLKYGGYLWMDDSLGLLMDHLESREIADNTLICFVADHGVAGKGSVHRDGTEVPCIMSWPAGMKQNIVCDELVQSTDFVATWFDLAGAELPEKYQLDGISFRPLFKQPAQPVRDYVYCENGPARGIKTSDWSYLTLRYTTDQVEVMRKSPRHLSRYFSGLSGGISRSFDKPGACNYDQLYHVAKDPRELNNLADNPEYEAKLEELKDALIEKLQSFPNRPYGELVPGGNTLSAGSFDDILEAMRELQQNDPRNRAWKN